MKFGAPYRNKFYYLFQVSSLSYGLTRNCKWLQADVHLLLCCGQFRNWRGWLLAGAQFAALPAILSLFNVCTAYLCCLYCIYGKLAIIVG